MRIRYLSLTNFRNYSRLELCMPEPPVLLYGANAQGKTSLLEAIYLLATGSSPVTTVDRQLVRWETDDEPLAYARVWAEIARSDRSHEIEIVIEKIPQADGSERIQKTVRVDRLRRRRADLANGLNVVLFAPPDVDIVAGAPARRRRYLDDTLCQVDGDYGRSLACYNEVLRQRNAALRHLRDAGGDPGQLSPFEEILAREGAAIIVRRGEMIAELSECARRIHRELTGGLEWLHLDYKPNFDPWRPPAHQFQPRLGITGTSESLPRLNGEDMVTAYRKALAERRREAIVRGSTLVGPHRDELRFVSGSPTQGTHAVDLGTYGSRGQQRTAVLSLKLAEVVWMRDQTHETPVLLLDEVLAELDGTRRRFLLAQVNNVDQAVLTATDPEMFTAEFRERALLWKVGSGVVVTG